MLASEGLITFQIVRILPTYSTLKDTPIWKWCKLDQFYLFSVKVVESNVLYPHSHSNLPKVSWPQYQHGLQVEYGRQKLLLWMIHFSTVYQLMIQLAIGGWWWIWWLLFIKITAALAILNSNSCSPNQTLVWGAKNLPHNATMEMKQCNHQNLNKMQSNQKGNVTKNATKHKFWLTAWLQYPAQPVQCREMRLIFFEV